MRLFKPSVGECADRSTILELKIIAGRKRGMSVEHFEKEEEEIDNYLQRPEFETIVGVKDEYYRMRRELYSVNLRLWNAEDDVRLIPMINPTSTDRVPATQMQIRRVALLCQEIVLLNDQRAALVRGMNGLYGPTEQEKIYVHANQ